MIKQDKIEETGGELTVIPNDKYKKFFAKFVEINTLPVEQWKSAHLIGFFCKKYKEAYGVEYSWKFNHQLPSKSFEVWQFNTLVAKLSKNPQILKDYIDWCFINIVPKAKRRLTSISFLTKEEVVIPYKLNVLLASQTTVNIDRTTLLPQTFIDIIQHAHGVNASTYGDLAFLHNSYLNNSDNGIVAAWSNTLQWLEKEGLDTQIIGRII